MQRIPNEMVPRVSKQRSQVKRIWQTTALFQESQLTTYRSYLTYLYLIHFKQLQ